MPIKLFFCYAREDESLLNQLKKHLKPLWRQNLIDLWYDRDIQAGTDWAQEIRERLDAAQIILLLISPDFMASDYCYGVEMKHAIERHLSGEACIIPVILRHVLWQGEPLGKFQALPTDGKPITDPYWYNQYGQDKPFLDVVEGIRAIVESFPFSLPNATIQSHSQASLSSIEEFVLVDGIQLGFDKPDLKDFNGEFLVAGGSEEVRLWDFHTRLVRRTFKSSSSPFKCVAISTDGRTLAIGSYDGSIELYTGLAGHKRIDTLSEYIECIAISTDGQLLASEAYFNNFGIIQLWNAHTGQLVRLLRKFPSVSSLAISANGQAIISGHTDKVRVWSSRTGQLIQELEDKNNTDSSSKIFFCVATTTDEQIVVAGNRGSSVGNQEGFVSVWNRNSGELLHHLDCYGITSMCLSNNGKFLVAASYGGPEGLSEVKIWNPYTGKLIQTLETVNVRSPLYVGISPNNQYLLVGAGYIDIWQRQ